MHNLNFMKIFYPFLFLSFFVFTGNSQTPLYNYDFEGGFQGWISNSLECGGSASDKAEWIWVDNGRIEGALSNFGLMDSRTPENGIVILNSDRKSTRLNSSHVAISYAVFCLKKKKCTNRSRSTNCQR